MHMSSFLTHLSPKDAIRLLRNNACPGTCSTKLHVGTRTKATMDQGIQLPKTNRHLTADQIEDPF
jgi:hypothetical protein